VGTRAPQDLKLSRSEKSLQELDARNSDPFFFKRAASRVYKTPLARLADHTSDPARLGAAGKRDEETTNGRFRACNGPPPTAWDGREAERLKVAESRMAALGRATGEADIHLHSLCHLYPSKPATCGDGSAVTEGQVVRTARLSGPGIPPQTGRVHVVRLRFSSEAQRFGQGKGR
jgi:hypothetical protein